MNTGILTVIVATISCIAAIISVIIAKNSSQKNQELARKANELQEENNRIQAGQKYFGWNDIEKYVNVVLKKMEDDNFVPTCIYVPSTDDAIFASMISYKLFIDKKIRTTIPVFVGILVSGMSTNTEVTSESVTHEGFEEVNLTPLANILIPKNLPINNSDKILLIRVHSVSGICFRKLIEYFSNKYGFNIRKENIKTACISTAENARDSVVNYLCIKANDIWFPWGKNG